MLHLHRVPSQFGFFAAAGLVLLSSSAARAADSSTLGAITLRPTIASVGVTAPVQGDDNGNATVALSFRKTGDAAFLPGHRLMKVTGSRAIGSVLFLEPATGYDVKVTLNDPDNAAPIEQTSTVTTRADAPAVAAGASLYVNAATGKDTNDGSQGAPLATIQAAANKAGPGMTVHVAPGVYRETVTIEESHGGAQGQPVWFIAEPGAILDGSDAALEDGSVFTAESGGIYSAPFTGECRYAAVDDLRLYDYQSLADLQSAAAGLAGGFFVDSGAGKIYIKLEDGSSPAGHKIHVAAKTVGFLIDTVTDVVIEGFEIRYYGSAEYSGVGVDVRDSSRCWVRKNTIHHMNEGVRVRRETAADNVIEDNSMRDTSVWTWPWAAVKAHTPEASSFSVTGAGGNIVRRNHSQGTFNGIYVGDFSDSSETIAPDTDIYDNILSEHGDDALEPEGACVNVRFWRNVIRGVYNGLSLSPIVVGPLFAVRNVIDGYKEHALKINNGPTGWMLVYHNTSVPSALVEAQAFAPSEPFSSFITRNNIWAGHRYVIESSITPAGPVDIDWDDLYTDSADGEPRFVKWLDVRYKTLDELKASNTIEQHGFNIQPAYENAAAGDFTPVAGSGLLDVGTIIEGVNDRFIVGAGPDLGAFERGGVGPTSDAGQPEGGFSGSGGSGGNPATGGSAGVGGSGTAGSGASAADGGTAAPAAAGDDGGCGCRTAQEEGKNTLAWLLFAAGLVAARRRRRA
ncbi:MAG: right-handed parallel beta-helix repeat-containing protein [Deltaproteobacteria bacterium]|nr:right-handed parallel beta-helix repeat-containing protein [Deltaproteobacteria bacterium]